jgi:TRAP-type C4-dicarboxylate transport system substrate-binding protein
MRNMSFAMVVSVLALAVLTLAGCNGDEATKAGGSGASVTLRVGTDENPGRLAGLQVEEFARRVEDLSGGKLRIEPVWEAAGKGIRDWDQRVARMVVGGELELGMVPARAWDTEGVTSLRALHAPFLVTSDELLDQVVAGELADEMLAGLKGAGVVGLTLVPEGLRHPFAFGEPLLSATDYAGARIRAPRSDVAYALFESLGASADDLVDPEFEQAVSEGSVAGAESSLGLVNSLPAVAVATGNVTFYPKVNSLVVNAETFAALDEGQREVLERAAAQTRAWAIDAMPTDVEQAQAYCEGGGSIVHANEADIASLQTAAAPVYDELERDAQTRSLIDAIRDLKSQATVADPAPATCDGSTDGPTGGSDGGDPSVLDGVYRTSFTLADLERSPLLEDVGELQDENWGDLTLTLDAGNVRFEQENEVAAYTTEGTFTVDGDVVVLTFTEGGNANETFTFRWQLDGDTLRFERASGPSPTPYVLQPWQKIG